MLVICKILNMPHVGGLDRRAIFILEIDSMDVVAYEEIPADEVGVDTLSMSNGQDNLFGKIHLSGNIGTECYVFLYSGRTMGGNSGRRVGDAG